VGGGIPIAAGMGLALKLQKRKQVIACFFGDGAANEGAFHEGINLASIWSLPVIFVCENNLYGASTHINKVMRVERVAQRAQAYGIRGETIDGNDVLAVYEATRTAVEECRNGKGPVLLELLTYRRVGHSRRDTNHYQQKDEQEYWLNRDPVALFRNRLVDEWDIGSATLDTLDAKVDTVIEAAVEAGRAAPEPTPDDLTTHVFASELR
jgi:TPP-dependent pyruvate/acetoin dehydrogenase alpha subunit